MMMDDYYGQMIFGVLMGLKLPDIRLTGEEKPRRKPHPGNLSRPWIEPGPAAWQARMLPLAPQWWMFTFKLYSNSTDVNRVLFYTMQNIRNLSLFSELVSYLICLYTTGPKTLNYYSFHLHIILCWIQMLALNRYMDAYSDRLGLGTAITFIVLRMTCAST